jgi:hypothetical protein
LSEPKVANSPLANSNTNPVPPGSPGNTERAAEMERRREAAKKQCRLNNILFVDEIGFEASTDEIIRQRLEEMTEAELMDTLKTQAVFSRFTAKSNGRGFAVNINLSEDGKEFCVCKVVCKRGKRILLRQVTEIRKGQKTKVCLTALM